MKPPLSYIPAVPPCVALTAGIVLGHLCGGSESFGGLGLTGGLIVGLLFVVGAFLYFRKMHLPAVCLWMTAAGFILFAAHSPQRIPEVWFDRDTCYSAEVVQAREGAASTNYRVEIVSIDGMECPKTGCMLTVNSLERLYPVGSKVEFTAKLKDVEDVPDSLEAAKAYARILKAEGFYVKAYVQPGSVWLLDEPHGMDAWLAGLRNGMFNGIVDADISPETAALLLNVVLGDGTYMTDDVREDFRTAGIAHVLALSGLHVGILAFMVSMLLLPMRYSRRGRAWRGIATMSVIWLYAFAVGMNPPIIRAAVMLSAMALAKLAQREANSWNSLALAVIVILIIKPAWLFSPGFQLSVSAVVSILLFSRVIPDRLRRRKLLFMVLNMLLLPVAAMLGTGVVSAYYFHYLPSMFFVANIATGIIFPPLLAAGFVLMLCTAAGMPCGLLEGMADFLYKALDWCVGLAASMGPGRIEVDSFPAWLFIPYGIGLVALALLLRRWANPEIK